MKTSLNKHQLLSLGISIGLLLVAAVLGWSGLGSLGEKKAEAQSLADQMGNPALAALLSDPGGTGRATRDAEEIRKMDEALAKSGGMAARWAQATLELAGAGQDWARDPGKWKDRLIAIQSQLQKDSKDRGVTLSPDFYLGLEDFRQKSPSATEVPDLALHLSVAERVVRLLIQAREVKEQWSTVCEFRTLVGPGSKQENQENPTPVPLAQPGAPPVETKRNTFRLEIKSSPEVLYEFVRLLKEDPALLVITDLAVANAKQTFPARSEVAKKFSESPPGAETPGGKKEARRLLEVLAGEESLNAALIVDFVAWRDPEDGKSPAAAPVPAR